MINRYITIQDGKYYFFDEKLHKHGPFETEEEAINTLKEYADELDNVIQQKSTGTL